MKRLLARHWRPLLGIPWFIAAALLTLQPVSVRWILAPTDWQTCLICGYGGSADAILNIVLFVPLGVVLGSRRRGWLTAFLVGLAISAAIEVTQLSLPGRWGGVADLVWNSAGAVVGVFVFRALSAHLDGRLPRAGVVWACFTAAVLLGAGVSMTPHPTDGVYWGQRTSELGSRPRYTGRVVSARLDARPMVSGQIDAPPPHRALLTPPWSLEGEVVVGEAPAAVSPVLSIHTIYRGDMQEILLLGAHREDLVFRERTLARHLRLDAPDLRIPGALAGFSPGDTVSIGVRRDPALCLRVGSVERCGLGVSPGRSWGLLLYLEGPSERGRRMLDFVWLALLFFPLGLLSRTRRHALALGLIGGGGILLSIALTPFIQGPWVELLACAVGLVSGRSALRTLRWIRAPQSR